MTDQALHLKQTTDTQTVVGLVCEHLRRTLPAASSQALGADTPLLEGGLLDSLGILQLTLFLGEHFGVEIEDTDFVPEHFATIRDVAALILRKTNA